MRYEVVEREADLLARWSSEKGEKGDFKRMVEARGVARPRAARNRNPAPTEGREVRRVKWDLSFNRVRTAAIPSAEAAADIDSAVIWRHLQNAESPLAVRSRLLAELIARNEDVAAFLIDELSRAQHDNLWRNELIFAAEHVQFHGAQRQQMANLLFAYAIELRGSAKPDTVSAIWAALRRYTSLMGREGVGRLIEFLSPGYDIGSRQVALQCVQRTFSLGPPDESHCSSWQALADRVSELTRKYLDRDWLTPGENSSLAINALYASASMGDESIVRFSRDLADLRIPRLTRMAKRFLENLTDSWHKAGIDYQSPPLLRLRRAIEHLK